MLQWKWDSIENQISSTVLILRKGQSAVTKFKIAKMLHCRSFEGFHFGILLTLAYLHFQYLLERFEQTFKVSF